MKTHLTRIYRSLRLESTLLFIMLMLLSSCTGRKENSITIAEQYGLAYAPLQIMRIDRILEKYSPNTEITYVKLANTAAIRESVVAGKLDAAFLGIPPFLIGRDKGMKWKICTGLSRSPLGLMVRKDRVGSLVDFGPTDKIALPQPGSIQHILLGMTLKRQGYPSDMLDDNLVALKHPDGMNALLSGAVQGHYTSPPYLFLEEEKPELTLLAEGKEAMDVNFSFIVGIVTEQFYAKHGPLYRAYIKAVEEAVDYVAHHPRETAKKLAPLYRIDTEVLEHYLLMPGMTFTTEVSGLPEFIDYMSTEGMIGKDLKEKDVLY